LFGKKRITMCREGLYYVVVLSFIVVGAILREINLLVVVAGMMLAPLLINIRLAIATLHRLRITRKIPANICAGDLLCVDILATNARRWLASWAVIVEDRVAWEGGEHDGSRRKVEVFVPHVGPGQTETTSYRGRLMRRGSYRFGPLRVSTRFPLGLVRRSVTMEDEQTLVVFPRVGTLRQAWYALLRAEQSGASIGRSRKGLHEGDFYGLRDWRAGDSRRWIHWRTSARRGALAVREFEQQHEQKLVVLLDLWAPDEPSDDQSDRVELAISFAASIVADQCRRGGSQLWVGTAGESAEVIYGASSPNILQEIMMHLALVKASSSTPLSELLPRGLSQLRGDGRLVVVSTRPLDLRGGGRLAELRENPQALHALQQCLVIDVGSQQLGEYFVVE
jgi:uncharacterized protein (DUF58 family)